MAKKIENIELPEIISSISALHEHGKQALKYHRNKWGLINDVDYVFNDDGSVNWRKLVNPKYLVLNRDKKAVIEAKYSRNLEELQTAMQEKTIDESDIDDQYKLILLAGIKELAKLRGYRSVDYQNNVTGPEYVSVKCTIYWIGNYETDNSPIVFSSLADAHIGSVKGYFANFLNCAAENRSFVRAVRNFLNISVVGFDEVGGTNPIEENQSTIESTFSATDPRFLLEKSFNELHSEFKVSWEILRKHLVEKKDIEDATNWKTVKDVPKDRAYDVISIVKDQLDKKRAKLNG